MSRWSTFLSDVHLSIAVPGFEDHLIVCILNYLITVQNISFLWRIWYASTVGWPGLAQSMSRGRCYGSLVSFNTFCILQHFFQWIFWFNPIVFSCLQTKFHGKAIYFLFPGYVNGVVETSFCSKITFGWGGRSNSFIRGYPVRQPD